jgi:Ca2+-binding EF-hand superfamily protein
LANLRFEREVRTPYSEAYLVMEQERQVGRVDIHFTPEMVHVAVSVDESLTQETVQQIIDTVDEDLVDAVGINRGNFVVHIFQGRETGVLSDENEFNEEDSGH